MTPQPRRRFFPARPAQTLPARSVELAVQVRKEAVAAKPVFTPATATWLLPQLLEYGALGYLQESPDGDWWEFGDIALRGHFYGTPLQLDGEGYARPVVGEGFVCEHVGIATNWNFSSQGRLVYGVLQGQQLGAVRWELVWNPPWGGTPPTLGVQGELDFDPAAPELAVSKYACRAWSWGNVLAVQTWPTDGGADQDDQLTAIAYIADQEAGRLTLNAFAAQY